MGHDNLESLSNSERRWSERVPVKGAAAALEYGQLSTVYELLDLSRGGARIRGPLPPPGNSFEILLHISDNYWERRARRVWTGPAGSECVGIEFERAEPGAFPWPDDEDDEDVVWVSSELSGQAEPEVAVVLDGYPGRASNVCRMLSLLGCAPVVATTPLDAVEVLDGKDNQTGLIVLAPSISSFAGDDLSKFFAAEYPGMRRVVMDSGSGARASFAGVHGLPMADALRAALDSVSTLHAAPIRPVTGQGLS